MKNLGLVVLSSSLTRSRQLYVNPAIVASCDGCGSVAALFVIAGLNCWSGGMGVSRWTARAVEYCGGLSGRLVQVRGGD